MTPDEFKLITGVGSILWGVAAIGVLIIQAIAWPDDSAKWSAMFAVVSIAVLTTRLSLSYLFGVALGTNEQGVWVFFGGGVLWLGFFVLCWRQNLGLYRRRFREIAANWGRRIERARWSLERARRRFFG